MLKYNSVVKILKSFARMSCKEGGDYEYKRKRKKSSNSSSR